MENGRLLSESRLSLTQMPTPPSAIFRFMSEYQSREGAVDLSRTPGVSYTYATGTGRHTRRLSTVYPGGREIAYSYNTSGSADDALGRVPEIKDTAP